MNDHLLPQVWRKQYRMPMLQNTCKTVGWALYQACASQLTPKADARKWDTPPLRVVCISDTHGHTPVVPDGDLLIHAGDLTVNGTYKELQAQIDWLASLPHRHKVAIAGNHDRLLDADYHFERRHKMQQENGDASDLDWQDCVYLNDSTVTLQFPEYGRQITVFGSPKVPECGKWAFQYSAIRDVWTNKIPDHANVVVTHAPPACHRDGVSWAGDGYLLRELRRVKPQLAVFGHIHEGYGTDILYHDGLQEAAEDLELGPSPLLALLRVATMCLFRCLTLNLFTLTTSPTQLVNAAIAPSRLDDRQKEAITVTL